MSQKKRSGVGIFFRVSESLAKKIRINSIKKGMTIRDYLIDLIITKGKK